LRFILRIGSDPELSHCSVLGFNRDLLGRFSKAVESMKPDSAPETSGRYGEEN
jgi:hypothetical protein